MQHDAHLQWLQHNYLGTQSNCLSLGKDGDPVKYRKSSQWLHSRKTVASDYDLTFNATSIGSQMKGFATFCREKLKNIVTITPQIEYQLHFLNLIILKAAISLWKLAISWDSLLLLLLGIFSLESRKFFLVLTIYTTYHSYHVIMVHCSRKF